MAMRVCCCAGACASGRVYLCGSGSVQPCSALWDGEGLAWVAVGFDRRVPGLRTAVEVSGDRDVYASGWRFPVSRLSGGVRFVRAVAHGPRASVSGGVRRGVRP